MKRLWSASLSCVLIAGGANALAETSYALGGGVNGQFKSNAKLDWNLGAEMRFDSSGRNTAIMPEGTIGYDLSDAISVGAGLRLMRRRDNQGVFRNRERMWLDGGYRWAMGEQWRFRYRLRWQQENRDPADNGAERRTHLRNRILASYRLNGDYQPYASVEFFHRMGGGPANNGLDRTRLVLGTLIDVGQRRELSAYLRSTERSGPGGSSLMIGATYEYTLQ